MAMTIRGVNIGRREFIGGIGASTALGLANRVGGAELVSPVVGGRYPGYVPEDLRGSHRCQGYRTRSP